MPNEVDQVISNFIQAAREKNAKKIEALIKSGYKINIKDDKSFTAAMYLGSQNDEQSCLFLVNHGAWLNDCAAGAAYANNKTLADKFLNRITNESKRDYLYVTCMAARGGHQALVEHFLNNIAHDKHNYEQIALWAAYGGHQVLVDYYLNKIKYKNKLYYQDMQPIPGSAFSRVKKRIVIDSQGNTAHHAGLSDNLLPIFSTSNTSKELLYNSNATKRPLSANHEGGDEAVLHIKIKQLEEKLQDSIEENKLLREINERLTQILDELQKPTKRAKLK